MIVFYNAWVVLGLAVFYFGPVEWPGASNPDVAGYVLFCLVAFDVGCLIAGRFRETDVSSADSEAERPRFLPRSTGGARAILVVHAVLTLVYLASVTGRSAVDGSAYSLDFGAVYNDYGDSLEARQVGLADQVVLLAKALVFPAALVIFVQRFRADPVVVLLFLVPQIVSSLFRGTDKEFVDVVILVVVAAVLHGVARRRILLGLVLLPIAGLLFIARRLSRFGGDLPACLPDSGVCFDYDSEVATTFGDRGEIMWVFLTNYLTNGYQGLAYAFRLDWNPTYGVGHLPPVERTLCALSEVTCNSVGYEESLTASGWDASARWTSVYTVLANDLSFWVVPVYLLLLGVVFARSLAAWRSHQDPFAGAAVVLVTMFWVYSSANMQIAISLDWAIATVALLYLAPWRTGDREQRRVLTPS